MDSSPSSNSPNNGNSGSPRQPGGISNGISASGSGELAVETRDSSSSSEDEGRRPEATSSGIPAGNTAADTPTSRGPGLIRSSTSQAPRHAPYPLPASGSRTSTRLTYPLSSLQASRSQSSNSARSPRASNPPPQQGASHSMDPIEAMLLSELNADQDRRIGDRAPQTTARERFLAGLRQGGRAEEYIREIMEVYDRAQ